MALVVSSAPLAALWAKTGAVARDEKRPPERAASASNSNSQASSRRASSGSSGAETLDSSSGSSFHTPPSDAKATATRKPRAKRHRGADVVLHVEDCAFALHSRVLKRKCRPLYRFIAQLRSKNAVGLLASGDGAEHDDDELEPLPLHGLRSSHAGDWDEPDDDASRLFMSSDKRFALRQCDPLRSAATPRQSRCPVLPRSQLSERATAASSPRSARFSKVCCVAHKRTDDASPSDPDEPRPPPRSSGDKHTDREEFSPGKENYASVLGAGSTVRSRALPRVALAPKMPFGSAGSSYGSSQRASPTPTILNTNVPAGSSPSSSASSRSSSCVAPDAFAVELVGASADAAATLIEFLYTGKTSGLHEGNAVTITSLCKWFSMDDHLLSMALLSRARGVQTSDQWMDVLLCCTNLHSKVKRGILIDYLLGRLSKLTPDQYRDVMHKMPLQRLSAIEDADLLAHIMTNMVNNLRSLEIWRKITFALELWLYWSFHRRFAALLPFDYTYPAPVRQPMSLLDFHHQFVAWDPVIRIPNVSISGIDAYIKATTLFSFGPFVFQVRLEPKHSPLMLWRIVRAGSPNDMDDEPEQCQFLPGLEPTFVIRGQLTILYKASPTGPLVEKDIAMRYGHTERDYGKWHVLLSTSSTSSRLVAKTASELESGEKTQEPDSSQEETAPLYPDSDTEVAPGSLALQPTSPVLPRTPPSSPSQEASGSSGNSPFEPIASRVSGQFFAWGHRLCNLYHYLLLSTLFYLAPRGSPRELRFEATQARMRELPVETLVLVLQSDRLRVPEGETTVAVAVAALCLSDYGALHFSVDQIRALFQCVRWCFVDLEQIMATLEHARRELQLYELVEAQLRDHFHAASTPRRTPWDVDDAATPYRATTTLVEFQIEAGDRSLSPSKFLFSQE